MTCQPHPITNLPETHRNSILSCLTGGDGFCCASPRTECTDSTVITGTTCNLAVPDCDREICGNAIDDDCDQDPDGTDPDCRVPEICYDGINNDGIGTAADDTNDLICFAPDAGNGKSGPKPEDCEECGQCAGGPVDVLTAEMYVGPHEDVRIQSGIAPRWDLSFERLYDSRAAKLDSTDDQRTTASVDEEPYPRILGAGWRHTYGDRLLLEGASANLPGSPAAIRWVSMSKEVRLFRTGTNSWGRSPGSSVRATRSVRALFVGGPSVMHWDVTDDDGDVYTFVENTNRTPAATKNHPWGETNPNDASGAPQYHVRLRYITPQNVPQYRIHVYHEQDLDVPSGATGMCNLLTAGQTDCTGATAIARGLLVAAVAEWGTLAAPVKGSSLEFKYTAQAGTLPAKAILNLDRILEGADRDDGVTTASMTKLVRYDYSASLTSPFTAKRLTRVADTRGCSGTTACEDATESTIRAYAYEASSPRERMLLSQKSAATQSTAGATTVGTFSEESFTWIGWEVATHKSPGVVLSGLMGNSSANGEQGYLLNDHAVRVQFKDGKPSQCSYGQCGDPERSNVRQRSSVDGREDLGVSSQPHQDGTSTIRYFSEDGQLLYEADVVPSVSTTPPQFNAPTTGTGFTEITVTGATSVRSITRHYYSTGTSRRRFASARISPYSASTLFRFPADASLPAGWRTIQTIAARTLIASTATFSGDAATYRYDVTVTDADDDGNGTLATDDTQVVWTHRRVTRPDLTTDYRSTLVLRDASGRVTSERTYGSTPQTVVSRTDTTFIAASEETRYRNRPLSVTRRIDPTLSSGGIVLSTSCSPDTTGNPYDELGRLRCWDVPQGALATAGAVKTTISDVKGTSYRRVMTTTVVQNSVTLAQTFEERTSSGFLLVAGTTSGNRSRFGVKGGIDPANATIQTTSSIHDQNDNLLARTALTVDGFGRVSARESFGSSGTAVRKATFTNFDLHDRAQTEQFYESNLSTPAAFATKAYDANSGDLLTSTEADGTNVNYIYGTSGADAGRLIGLDRAASTTFTRVQTLEYDSDGRVKRVLNGPSTEAAAYTYDGDGRLVTETLTAAGGIRRGHSQSFGLGRSYAVMKLTSPTGTLIRDVETTYDALGRTMYVFDTVGQAKVSESFYDTKAGFISSYTAGNRSIALTDNNQAGRLAYVKHEGGYTFYEYDGLGRVLVVVQNESTTVSAANMRPTTYAYSPVTGDLASIRYPSGRMVIYAYGNDHRLPTTVSIEARPDLGAAAVILAYSVDADAEGNVNDFLYGNGTKDYNVGRDLQGRVYTIVGSYSANLSYTYDGDGDLLTESEGLLGSLASAKSIFSQTGTPPVSRTYGYHAFRDVLSSWPNHTLTHGATGLVSQESELTGTVPATASHVYGYTSEKINYKDASAMTSVADVSYGMNPTTAETSGIDRLINATTDVTPLYGPLGEVRSVSALSSGTWLYPHDHQMKRWRKTPPVPATMETTKFRYGARGELLDEEVTINGGSLQRDEWVYLAGMRIGVMHSTSTSATHVAQLTYAVPDRMGVVRRILTSSLTSDAVLERLIMEPYGQGSVQDDRVSGSTWNLPSMKGRNAGQYFDAESGLIENGWRMLAPETGGYISPDPMHQASSQGSYGPQAYAYASGRPLLLSDPLGLTAADQRKIVSWGRDAINTMTALGLRTENQYWNNFCTNALTCDYLMCAGQVSWTLTYLRKMEAEHGLDDLWFFMQETDSYLPTIMPSLGHTWLIAKNVGNQEDCGSSCRYVQIDPWYGISQPCQVLGSPQCPFGD